MNRIVDLSVLIINDIPIEFGQKLYLFNEETNDYDKVVYDSIHIMSDLVEIGFVNENIEGWDLFLGNYEIKDKIFSFDKPTLDFSFFQKWDRVPDNYQYWAMDKSGYTYWYEQKPIKSKHYDDFGQSHGGLINAGYRNDLLNYKVQWENSIVKRPNNK
jgi:hypothetical protein